MFCCFSYFVLIHLFSGTSPVAKVMVSSFITAGTDIFASVIQLVVAVLLIVLAVIIVINSAKSYAKSKKGSEVKEAKEA